MTQSHRSTSEAQTIEIAQNIARKCANNNQKIFHLSGPMGAGKSVFARAFIRHLMNEPALDVPSPTFTLVQTYDAPPKSIKQAIWHFDLYRLEDPEEVYEIGWEDAIDNTANNILLIEWPEKLGILAPSCYTNITITPIDDETRDIVIEEVSTP